MCGSCYSRRWRYGDPNVGRGKGLPSVTAWNKGLSADPSVTPCVSCGRTQEHKTAKLVKGLCGSCYKRLKRYGSPDGGSWRRQDSRAQVRTADGCLIDTGRTNPDGYVYDWQQDLRFAHRVAYVNTHGAIPEGMTVDHICHNVSLASDECAPGACEHRRCVEPSHLRALSWSDHSRVTYAASRGDC